MPYEARYDHPSCSLFLYDMSVSFIAESVSTLAMAQWREAVELDRTILVMSCHCEGASPEWAEALAVMSPSYHSIASKLAKGLGFGHRPYRDRTETVEKNG